jgi:hypothetical protein
MAKFRGIVGYVINEETAPGVWEPKTYERTYSGDVVRNVRSKWQSSEYLNDNLTISQQISIVADPFAFQHFHAIRYINYMGVSWKVTDVEVQRPRLILTTGGEWNE